MGQLCDASVANRSPLLPHGVPSDPVKLPSGTIVDRTSIQQHLVDHTFDPFNRAEMTMDQVVPIPELKSRVDAYIASKKAKK